MTDSPAEPPPFNPAMDGIDWLERAKRPYCDVCGGPHAQNHTLGRLRWAVRTAHHAEPLTFVARMRLLWHDFVIHGLVNRGGERCQDCGRDTGWFQVDDDEWIAVMGYPSGLLCRPCFTRRAPIYRKVADQHRDAIELARQIVADPLEYGENRMANALVAIDEAMRSALTHDR